MTDKGCNPESCDSVKANPPPMESGLLYNEYPRAEPIPREINTGGSKKRTIIIVVAVLALVCFMGAIAILELFFDDD